jgi:hypothetical protein
MNLFRRRVRCAAAARGCSNGVQIGFNGKPGMRPVRDDDRSGGLFPTPSRRQSYSFFKDPSSAMPLSVRGCEEGLAGLAGANFVSPTTTQIHRYNAELDVRVLRILNEWFDRSKHTRQKHKLLRYYSSGLRGVFLAVPKNQAAGQSE